MARSKTKRIAIWILVAVLVAGALAVFAEFLGPGCTEYPLFTMQGTDLECAHD